MTEERGHRTIDGKKAISLSSFAGSREVDVVALQPWPEGTFLQGGDKGVVLSRKPEGNYTTAFVEAHNQEIGFIRGEGATWEEAEAAAWAKAQKAMACPGHEWEPRDYTNGGGFCKNCNRFKGDAFTAEDLGLTCEVCKVFTNWHRESDGTFRCKEHTPHVDSIMCGCPKCCKKYEEAK